MAAPRSLAERLRDHREEFTLALELGCTPKEAREQIDRAKALAKFLSGQARLAALRSGRPIPPPQTSQPEQDDAPRFYWQRD